MLHVYDEILTVRWTRVEGIKDSLLERFPFDSSPITFPTHYQTFLQHSSFSFHLSQLKMKFAATLLSAATLAFVASAAPAKRYESHTGPATFYSQGSEAGSCGNYNSDSSYVVAMPGW